MTREELKAHCERQIKECEMWAKRSGKEPAGKIYEEHKLILELLETEPCGDYINRQAVMELPRHTTVIGEIVYLDDIKALPPVNPKVKTGKWILVHPLQENDEGGYMCSKCGTGYYDNSHWNYCPNCGNPKEVTK